MLAGGLLQQAKRRPGAGFPGSRDVGACRGAAGEDGHERERQFPASPVRGESSPSYWEGSVLYSGTQTGVGYLEMTGYAKPMRL